MYSYQIIFVHLCQSIASSSVLSIMYKRPSRNGFCGAFGITLRTISKTDFPHTHTPREVEAELQMGVDTCKFRIHALYHLR